MNNLKNLFLLLSFTCLTSVLLCSEEVIVDLNNPIFCEGVLSTSQGGIVNTDGIRIQAKNITYTQRNVNSCPQMHIQANENLIVEYGNWIFVGESFEYDFITHTGTIISGRSFYNPWFFGGELIKLQKDGSLDIIEGFVTTSENLESDWQIESPHLSISNNHFLHAHSVCFRFVSLPIFWFPSFKMNLDDCNWTSPIKIRARLFGRFGPYVGISYNLYNDEEWRVSLLLDYSLRRGFGGGLEAEYQEEGGPRYFFSRNYVINEQSEYDPSLSQRYRIFGVFLDYLESSNINIDLTYDKVSDKYMPSDYVIQDLDTNTIAPTQFTLLKQEINWIAYFKSVARLNDFETTKEELPTLSLGLRPISIANTGIISDTQIKTSYLEFLYEEDIPTVTNYRSARLEWDQRFYRSFNVYPIIFTPEAGWTTIAYSDNPKNSAVTQAIGYVGLEAITHLSSTHECWKHVIEPYIHFQSFSASLEPIKETFIFDINDGWANLHIMELGILSQLYIKNNCHITRPFELDLYTYAFIDARTLKNIIPRYYMDLTWLAFPNLKYTLSTVYNTSPHQIESINLRSDLTLSEDIAVSLEYRHRTPYSWRKLDIHNFFLDVVHNQEVLLASPLSDQRDTFLSHLFWRINPWIAFETRSHLGWNRKHQPFYFEYQIDLHTHIRGNWGVRYSYQHKENDDRFIIFFSFGERKALASPCDDFDLNTGNY